VIVAAFDLDGTITRRDTLLPFLLAVAGRRRVARAGAAIAGTRGGRTARKEALLRHTLGGRPRAELEPVAEAYAAGVVERGLRPSMRAAVEEHLAAGHRVVIVTASPELYASPLGHRLGVDEVLGTVLEVDGAGTLTGRLAGPNCRGDEKAARLLELLGAERPEHLHAYGNSGGDDALLALADTAVRLRRGRPPLRPAGGGRPPGAGGAARP
jgi:phosphatidylglycerophosphatase C